MSLRNIFNIIIKEIKIVLRDRKSIMMMVLLPILLMAILGAALSGVFDSSISLDEIKVLYTNEGSQDSVKMFNTFMEEGKKLKMDFTRADSIDEGTASVKDVKYACYVRVKDNGEILLYKNERHGFNAEMVESVLTIFVHRYNVMSQIAKVNPISMKAIASGGEKNLVKLSSVNAKRQPRSIDYYSVTMLTLIIMYAANIGAWSVKGEKTEKTGSRLLAAPVKKYEILIAKILGSITATAIQIIVVILVSKYILKGYWGSNMSPILLIILTQIIMTVAIGAGIAFMVKSETSMSSIISTTIPFIVFLGGGYVPLDQFKSNILMQIAKISPLKWTNDAIFQIIYNNNFSMMGEAIVINLGIAALFIIISSILFKREAI